jgi:uncharacterized surface protein with fasciclin (FAS1) repeats
VTTINTHPEFTEFAELFQQAFGTEGAPPMPDAMGSWTIFALTNDLIDDLYPHTLHTPETMSNYVLEGAYTYQDLWQLAEEGDGSATLTTLGGEELTVTIDGGILLIQGVARIETAYEATNGVIFAIDTLFEDEPPAEGEAAGG